MSAFYYSLKYTLQFREDKSENFEFAYVVSEEHKKTSHN